MTAPGRTAAEYKAVATFLQFIGKPENDAYWHQHTGYVPVTFGRLRAVAEAGLLRQEPGRRSAGEATDARHGDEQFEGVCGWGGSSEIRNIIYEEMEKAFQGGQTAQQAMDSAVSRGNKVLRDFEKSVKDDQPTSAWSAAPSSRAGSCR